MERRSTLLNHCLLRAVRMQRCYAWNHRRQRWHTPSGLLLSFTLPSPWRKREKKRKTSVCMQPKLLRHHKPGCCIAEAYATIFPQLLWCTQMQQRVHSGLPQCVFCRWQKRQLHSKMHPAVRSYLFLSTYFSKECGPDLIAAPQRGQIERHTFYVQCAQSRAAPTPPFRYRMI